MIDEILRKEIEELVIEGKKMYKNFTSEIVSNYQIWYSKAHHIVAYILPERIADFEKQYDCKKSTGDINSYFSTFNTLETVVDNTKEKAVTRFAFQIGILKSCIDMIDYRLRNIRNLVEAEMFDNQLDCAKNLLKKGYYRAAGAICGVVLESHFNSILQNHNINKTKKVMHLSDYNDLLRDNDIYEITTWRKIQYLSDLRNKCDHDKGVEPTKEEIQELISGCDSIIKNIY